MVRGLSLAVAGMIAATVLTSSAAADNSWGEYHWARTANPFTLSIGDNVSGVWDGHLVRASADWSADGQWPETLNTTIVVGGNPTGGRRKKTQCQPTAGRIEVCNGTYGRTGWLGVATIWLTSGGHITQATAKMNDTYFNDTTRYDETARRHVMCQEIGHDFGLDHQDESGADLDTCMDYSRALDNPTPNQHDYQQLSLIYTHLDATTTLAAAAPADEEPVKVDRKDRITHSLITEYYEGGAKRVTHVFWALPGPHKY